MPIAESGLLPVLTLLAGHRDPVVSSHACGAIANLAENMRTHERVLGTGAANTLSLLCDPNTVRRTAPRAHHQHAHIHALASLNS